MVKNVPENETFNIEDNEKIIDIAERILELNSEKQLKQKKPICHQKKDNKLLMT